MLKKWIIIAFTTIFVIIIALASGIKDSYKILQVKPKQTLEVPPYADWHEFVAENGRFKVMLPMTPQYAKDAVPIPETNVYRNYEMYISQKLDGPIFFISVITYPEGTYSSNTEVLLRDVVEELSLSRADNKLKELEETKYEGYDALDFRLENGRYEIVGKTFVIEKTVYLLAYIAEPSYFTLTDYDHFVSSFHLSSEFDKKRVKKVVKIQEKK